MTLKFTCQNMYCKIQGYNGNDIDVHMCEFGNRTISHFQFENSNQKWRWGASNKQIKTRWNYPPLWRRLDDYESLRLEGLWVSKLIVLLTKRRKMWRTMSLGFWGWGEWVYCRTSNFKLMNYEERYGSSFPVSLATRGHLISKLILPKS